MLSVRNCVAFHLSSHFHKTNRDFCGRAAENADHEILLTYERNRMLDMYLVDSGI